MNMHTIAGVNEVECVSDIVAQVAAGNKGSGILRVGSMASGQPICIPVVVARGQADGPVLWLNGAVHGDEINGILASMDFLANLDCQKLRGTVIATPVSNPLALDARSKRVPQDGQDLDQSFPGQSTGMISQLVANTIFSGIRQLADVVVNFHTMNPYFSSVPYAVYKLAGQGAASEEKLLAAIANFSPFVACRMSVTSGNELPGNNSGALDYQSLKAGKLAFMVELGGGSRQEPAYIEAGLAGLQALGSYLNMLDEPSIALQRQVCRVTDRTHVYAREGGFFRQLAPAGTLLAAGVPLGIVQNFAGELVEETRFDCDVLVIGVRSDPVVHSGDRVGFVALEWDSLDVS